MTLKSDSEDNLLISRIQSLHHLLEGDYHDEEECSVASTLDNRWRNNLLVDEQARVRLRGFALAFDRLAKASTFDFNAQSSNCIS